MRIPFSLLVLGSACLLAGCASREAPMYPVRGQVFYRNKPLAEAQVVFHCLDGSPQASNKPIAFTDAGGRFALTTMKQGDGAPLGEYAITIELRELGGDGQMRTGASLLPERFRLPEKTGLKFRVEKGDNEVPRIDVED